MKVELRAKDVWQLLNGVLCVYKPRDISIASLQKLIVNRICEDGNELEQPSIPLINVPVIEPHPESQALVVTGTRRQPDYSRHPLLVGRNFHPQDIMIEPIRDLEPACSGVCAFAVGPECHEIDELRYRPWINAYRIDAKLGEETHQHMIRARVAVKAEWEHVTRHKLEKLLTRVRAQYKRASFKLASVDLQSQAAFELARRGAPRPDVLESPLVYAVDVTSFNTPYFGLSMQVIGETDYFLRAFVHELGLSLGSTACPKRVRRTRFGPLTAEHHALLDKDLSLVNILRNVLLCNRALALADAEAAEPVVRLRKASDLASTAAAAEFNRHAPEEPPSADADDNYDCLRVAWGREYTSV